MTDGIKKERSDLTVMALNKDDPELKKTVQDAQSSLGVFFSLYEQYNENLGVYFGVKVPIPDDGKHVHLWYTLTGIKDDIVTAEHHNIPESLQEFGNISIKSCEIEDWMINDHGHLYGGYSIRLQRSRLPDNEKEKFDENAWIEVYKDNDF